LFPLKWIRCAREQWCTLAGVNLDQPYFDKAIGVYVAWFEDDYIRVLKAGEGSVRNRILEARSDPRIGAYDARRTFVTWALAPKEHRAGLVNYLQQSLQPALVGLYKTAYPIKCNLPWDE
jgi:hypothetical protein